MNTTQIRNRLAVLLLGVVASVVTYLLLQRVPDIGLAGQYLQANFIVFFVFIGAVLVTRLTAQSYWYEVVAEFFLSFAITSTAVFIFFITDPLLIGLLLAAAVVGGVLTEGIFRLYGPARCYQFVSLLLAIIFSFVVVYIAASILYSGNITLLPPLAVYTIIFVMVGYGLREESLSLQSP